MTTESHNLLRMLEPAVRPGQVRGPQPAAGPAGKTTFEHQTFDAMLQQARAASENHDADTTEKPTAQRLLEALGHTENASVRKLMEAPQTPRPDAA